MTVPDTYPMTLNGLTVGASQKNNRDPYRAFHEWEIEGALRSLIERGLVSYSDHHMGGRTRRYAHRLDEKLGLDKDAVAVLGELLLRGPQQPGELRTRADRMTAIPTQEHLGAVLDRMAAPCSPPLVVKHIRRSGERAERWSQTLATDNDYLGITSTSLPAFNPTPNPLASIPRDAHPQAVPPAEGSVTIAAAPSASTTVAALEARVVALEAEVAAWKACLDGLAPTPALASNDAMITRSGD
jgi:uncharacterized protein YceH (UPF0502 family)